MSAQVPVAIIGIGYKIPGGSDNKDLYYEFLRSKVCPVYFGCRVLLEIGYQGDGVIEPPPKRWIHEEWYGAWLRSASWQARV